MHAVSLGRQPSMSTGVPCRTFLHGVHGICLTDVVALRMLQNVDLNLLPALDALLDEASVARAAQRLHLSESAMSRTLTRLRSVLGDPLLVRAGRGMVLTPHARQLREPVRALTQTASALLRPAGAAWDLSTLQRTFVLRTNDGFVEGFGAALVTRAAAQAPGVCLRFAPKPDKSVQPLRDGSIDLDVGVLGPSGPEVKLQSLYRDRFVGVVRTGHALLAPPGPTAARYAASRHVITSRRGRTGGPVDEALAAHGLTRQVAAIVPTFRAGLLMAAQTDLVALVPASLMTTDAASTGLVAFELPVDTPPIIVSQMWHPRMDADPGHRWLRHLLVEVCRVRA